MLAYSWEIIFLSPITFAHGTCGSSLKNDLWVLSSIALIVSPITCIRMMQASKTVIPQGDNKKSSTFCIFLHLSSMIEIERIGFFQFYENI